MPRISTLDDDTGARLRHTGSGFGRGLADLAASAARTSDELQTAQRRGVQTAALHVTRAIRSEILGVTGDMRLSGVGRKGAKVGAKFDVKGTSNPTALIAATGPLHLVERDTRSHPIYPKGQTFSTTRKGNVRRRGRTRALKYGGRFSAYAEHPGTKGQHPFSRGVKIGSIETPHIFQNELRGAIRRAWL